MKREHSLFIRASLVSALTLVFLVFSPLVLKAQNANFAVTDASAEAETLVTAPVGSVVYPITELGNCADRAACRAYCVKVENRPACFDWAVSRGLVNAELIKKIKEKLTVEVPGVCTGASCKEACRLTENKDACLEVAEKRGLINKGWVQRAKAIRDGIEGKCQGIEGCRAYCAKDENADECLSFVERKGLLSPTVIGRLRGVLQSRKELGVPLERLRNYCAEEANKDRCINVAEKYKAISGVAIKAVKALREGVDGKCSGLGCVAYCAKEENRERCLEYAEGKGVVTKEQAVRIREKVRVLEDVKPQNNALDSVLKMTPEEIERQCAAMGDAGKCAEFRSRVEMMKKAGQPVNTPGAAVKPKKSPAAPKPISPPNTASDTTNQ